MITLGGKVYVIQCPNCKCSDKKEGDRVLLCKRCGTILGRLKKNGEMDYAADYQ